MLRTPAQEKTRKELDEKFNSLNDKYQELGERKDSIKNKSADGDKKKHFKELLTSIGKALGEVNNASKALKNLNDKGLYSNDKTRYEAEAKGEKEALEGLRDTVNGYITSSKLRQSLGCRMPKIYNLTNHHKVKLESMVRELHSGEY